jgi:hypothetical protein
MTDLLKLILGIFTDRFLFVWLSLSETQSMQPFGQMVLEGSAPFEPADRLHRSKEKPS